MSDFAPVAEPDYLERAIYAVEKLRAEWEMDTESESGANYPLAIATAQFLDEVYSWRANR
jgi:hypothetical protein